MFGIGRRRNAAMKYFFLRDEKLPHPLPNMLRDIAYEVPAQKAYEMYILVAKNRDMAVIDFMNGTRTPCKYWTVWGEEITEAECFQRKLAGKLAVDILE